MLTPRPGTAAAQSLVMLAFMTPLLGLDRRWRPIENTALLQLDQTDLRPEKGVHELESAVGLIHSVARLKTGERPKHSESGRPTIMPVDLIN